MSDHDHVWVCADNVTDGERNHPEGYVYCSECLAPKNKKWRVTVELPVEAPTATGAMDKVDAMFHLEQWRGMSAKPWRDDEYYDDLGESANTAHAIRFPSEYKTPGRTVTKEDVITIVPESGPRRQMRVAHVEHHIITLSDLPPEYQHPDE